MIKRFRIDETICGTSFVTERGAEEHYFTITTTGEAWSIDAALARLQIEYEKACTRLGLSEDTVIFCRFYLSDIANQKDAVLRSPLFKGVQVGVVSLIQQNPLTKDAVVLLVYHVKKNDGSGFSREIANDEMNRTQRGVSVKGDHYRMAWTANDIGTGANDSKQQTASLFESFARRLRSRQLSVRNNLVRTWVYVRDIDNNYASIVEARKTFFDALGLTKETRYVASTGIEGKAANAGALVCMDSLSFGNIVEEQLAPMNAFENLSPTIVYGVTFERGLRVTFGDRSHLYISGTASIDKNGEILHGGDVVKQTERTIENVAALLSGQGATLSDLAYLLCYVRNPKHFEIVRETLKAKLPGDIPTIIVEGAVCRPEWLFEMEGVAIIDKGGPYPAFL